jgi:hypothetical protein
VVRLPSARTSVFARIVQSELFKTRKVNLSDVFAGQKVGVTQVGERIWLVTFMHRDLGDFDDETCRLDLGYAVGAVVAGVTADAFGLAAALWVIAALTLASGIVSALRMTETRPARRAPVHSPPMPDHEDTGRPGRMAVRGE